MTHTARNKFDIDETLEKDSEFNIKHIIRLGKYVRTYKADLLKTFGVTIVGSVLGLTGPYVTKLALDNALPPAHADIPLIILLAGALLAATVINIFLIRFRVKRMSKVGQGIIRDIRLDLFTHLQELPFSYYDSRPHGKILVRVVNYINSLSDMLSNGIINVATDSVSLFVIIGIMLSMNVRLTLVSMAGLPLLLAVTYIIKIHQRKAWRLHSAKQSNMNAYIHESIAGVKITQSFVREDVNRGIFAKVTDSVRQAWLKACSIQFFMWPSAMNISVWTTCLLYILGVNWLFDGKNGGAGVTVGVLVAFGGYIGRFWDPINNIANFYNSIVVNMTYMERIFEAIDEPVIVRDVENAVPMPMITGAVKFENVTFSYDKGFPVLNGVSFECRPGDAIALVGPTGAGKTTVVNLISRFYDVDSGKITVDGTDIHGVTLKSLRSQMGIMLQDSFIFAGTIYDNIRYSKLDATDEEIEAAARAVKAHDFITEMENGYRTEVNERGSRLSVGQRQLISFARALLA
ncbi:MAG: ABC transporter ATP-binding protein/permease, partial [Firmicutes bacterium]|nr:ABC transporter ATP-binding protein/permease [Bacillota bacterium]